MTKLTDMEALQTLREIGVFSRGAWATGDEIFEAEWWQSEAPRLLGVAMGRLVAAAQAALPGLNIEDCGDGSVAAYLPGNPLYTAQRVAISADGLVSCGEQECGSELFNWLVSQGFTPVVGHHGIS